MQRIAVGVGIVCDTFRKPATNSFSSMAFMGLPCPRNKAGMGSLKFKSAAHRDKPLRVFIYQN
jgi:hypothetical protein